MGMTTWQQWRKDDASAMAAFRRALEREFPGQTIKATVRQHGNRVTADGRKLYDCVFRAPVQSPK